MKSQRATALVSKLARTKATKGKKYKQLSLTGVGQTSVPSTDRQTNT